MSKSNVRTTVSMEKRLTAMRYTLSQIQKQPSQISWILHCGVGDPAKGTRVQVDDYRSVEGADSQAMPQ